MANTTYTVLPLTSCNCLIVMMKHMKFNIINSTN